MSQRLDEKTRLIALAHLANGKKPKEVADDLELNYGTVVKLRKDLQNAQARDEVDRLFKLPEATLSALLDAAKKELMPAFALTPSEAIEGELETLKEGLQGLNHLETNLQNAASTLANRINTMALTATTAETVVMLSKALSDLNTSFFAKGTNVQVNNLGGEGFERLLRD